MSLCYTSLWQCDGDGGEDDDGDDDDDEDDESPTVPHSAFLIHSGIDVDDELQLLTHMSHFLSQTRPSSNKNPREND